MKTRSAAMAEDSQQLAQLQSQVTSLQAKMATRSEIQSTREVVDRLTQMVQLLMNDRPKNLENNQSITLKPTLKPTFQTDILYKILSHTFLTHPPSTLAVSHIPFRTVHIPGRALNPRPLDWSFCDLMEMILKLGVAGLRNSLRCIAHWTPNVSPFPPST